VSATPSDVARAPREFSTAGLPAGERIERWERHNSTALIGLQCRTIGSGALDAREINVELGALGLARVIAGPHIVERSTAHITASPVDSIALYFTLSGEAFFYRDDGVRTLRPGQVLAMDADTPFVRGFSGGLDELVVRVPRTAFADHTGLADLDNPVVAAFNGDPQADALAHLVARALSADATAPADEDTLLDLVAFIATGGRRAGASTHLAAAKAFIAAHLTDPRLGAAMVAAGVGLSARQLSRVFADSGVSVPHYIRERRLDRAHALLIDTARQHLPVADIAAQCGFGSAAHFSTAFAERFGAAPSEIRRRR
jgi:AraC-like DNA-binding protein